MQAMVPPSNPAPHSCGGAEKLVCAEEPGLV